MKILITGALGHIGSALIRELSNFFECNEYILIDDFSTQRYCSLFNLNSNISYEFHELDVTECKITDHIKECDYVIHLAAITDATSSFSRKDEVEGRNYAATKNVALQCMEADVPLIYISSTSVYGPQGSLVDEECDRSELNPQSPYAETKLKEENLLLNDLVPSGLRCTIFRFGTIFGTSPGMRFHTAVNKFCWQASNSLPLTIWETAYNQVRPYLHIRDAIGAIAHVIRINDFHAEIYNVVTCNASVYEIVEAIRLKYPSVSLNFVQSEIMNQLSYHVSSKKFEKLGYKFVGDLHSGIEDTLNLLKTVEQ